VKILGVDPGGSGALALLSPGLLLAVDMPVFMVMRGKTAKAEVDFLALADLLAEWQPDVCYFEQVGGIPGQAASAAFNFGRAVGLAEGAAKGTRARFVAVPPATWKRRMGLPTGQDKKDAKDASRAMATSMWPSAAALFRRVKDDGRAEAALLAEYGRRLELPAAQPAIQDIFA
jgi:crossover junction endodeoxyribonuclease RuvC